MMATTESSSPINYYEILQCNPSDSIDDIKKSYQQLILRHHPDKKCASNSLNNAKRNDDHDVSDSEFFHRIDAAWKFLRDPEKRKKYDAEMQQYRFNDEPIVHAHCKRNDFNFDANTQAYIYPCRCGGFFVLPDEFAATNDCDINKIDAASAANHDEIFIECDECSFVVRLLRDE